MWRARHVVVGLLRQELEHRGLVLGKHAGLVGRRDAVAQHSRAAAPGAHRLQLLRRVLDLHRPLDELESRLDHLELAWHQLLGLDQDVLAHADLAEVVQKARVAELLELVLGKAHLAVLPGGDAAHRSGE